MTVNLQVTVVSKEPAQTNYGNADEYLEVSPGPSSPQRCNLKNEPGLGRQKSIRMKGVAEEQAIFVLR